jgi:sialic acid synthase SpsE
MSTPSFEIEGRRIGPEHPTYIIAEIGSNFDGSLERARKLIDLAQQSGADAVKFQSFLPDKFISREGFERSGKASYQDRWEQSVYDVYDKATFPREWHKHVRDHCRLRGITFFSAPYDAEAVDLLEQLEVPAYKIGSGDISWLSQLERIARLGKPIILGCGATTLAEIDEAVRTIRSAGNEQIALLQCVTYYPSPFEDANLRAMVAIAAAFGCVVGYSDHTPGSVVPLGAVALGGRLIEKHFTDDKTRKGPDHGFAMDAPEFARMVGEIRQLELALGNGVKRVMPSENATWVLQRRSIYAASDIPAGTVLTAAHLTVMRPQVELLPRELPNLLGRTTKVAIRKGEPIRWRQL